ncbi:HAD-IA family hydrolase [Glaciecola petra]|uniref:HAD-IA family hydrolase n=1 Tax=Glaciecola petra TaxID=3075602 RepID=A0ABU2ZSR4_9ALTE|nr:HAD-IA family hydrolase [Aestuariibacter sp. P117]MDT0595679.1 HAD-IA family hydrolase [Aestuariibacter sp. P117]
MIVYKRPHSFNGISFDLDDTFYDNMPYIYAAEKALNEYINKHYPTVAKVQKHEWQAIRQQTLSKWPYLKNEIGEFRLKVLEKGFRHAGVHESEILSSVADCFAFFYRKRSDFKVPKSVSAVLDLLSKHFKLAAITNGNVDCEAIGISRHFKTIIHASKEYPMKPEPAIFLKAAQDLELKPKEILHVGDDLHKDIFGATNAGYQTAWLAVNRKMLLHRERVCILPSLQLNKLSELNVFCN